MKVPDELLGEIYECTSSGRAVEKLKKWFAGRTLVDLTVCGPQCPGWDKIADEMTSAGTVTHAWCQCPDRPAPYMAPTGQPCPVMAARVTRS